jgi:DNA-binding HxlR family transcriptional regulator
VLCQNGTLRYNEISPRVEYSLTEIWKKLLPVLDEFAKWGEELMEIKKL